MSDATTTLHVALQQAMAIRPLVGGFPYLAEALRQAGVRSSVMTLPACQCLYVMESGNVITQDTPLVSGMAEVPAFDEAALIAALRRDQSGEGTFPEFLAGSWKAGVVGYEVDFAARTVTYYGAEGESYVEAYPAVDVSLAGMDA